MSDGLPEGWASVRVGEACRLVNGRAFKPSDWGADGLRIIRIQNLNNLHAPFNHYSGSVEAKFLVQEGELLFAWSGTPGTSFGAHIWTRGTAILNQHIFRVLDYEGLFDKGFLRRAINVRLDHLIEVAHGTAGLAHVTRPVFEAAELSLPPASEQRRIVTQVEALLEQVNRAKGRLDRVPLILKRFRQAVLAAACSGELTRGWRDDARIDQNWTITAVGALCPLIQYGYTASASRGDGPRFLRITDIQDGRVVWATVPSCEISAGDIKKFELRRGDIVFARSGATTGKSFLIAGCPPAVFASYLIRVRPGPRVTSKFLHLCFQTPDYWAYITENMAGNAQPNCNASKLAALEVPVPSSQEQDEIVRQVEKLFALADTIEARVKAATARADMLPQAILSKAFSGELVPTEAELARAEGRSYETAEELLRRVRAAQDASDARGAKPRAGKSAAVRNTRAQSRTRAT